MREVALERIEAQWTRDRQFETTGLLLLRDTRGNRLLCTFDTRTLQLEFKPRGCDYLIVAGPPPELLE